MTTRQLDFLLAEPERRLLRAIARRLPPAVHSDHLTALGVIAAIGAGVAYALTSVRPAWLWVASAFLALNWLGDSLDGTLARVRQAERPRYGYYLDHLVDALSTTALGVGIGLSPYVDLRIALGAVLAYLVLSINVYLESTVLGVFRLAYGRIGPTEVRLLLILGNAVAVLASSAAVARLANPAVALLLALIALALLLRCARNLAHLASVEPRPMPPPR
ncbi:MAG: CDP-alcohol phosphatidyltransferase family protein [Gemmatimonadales bacterium]